MQVYSDTFSLMGLRKFFFFFKQKTCNLKTFLSYIGPYVKKRGEGLLTIPVKAVIFSLPQDIGDILD